MRNGLLLFIFLVNFTVGFAQNQESHWIFGFNCEMSFDGGTPVDEGLGQLYVTEGSASIANADGSLLFFTDGGMVYDRNGNPMPNGSEVAGHDSSTQNVLIVPQPGDQEERFYFVFSVPAQMDWNGNFTNSGLGMVQIDMQANGGLGDVIGSGTQLTESATEMLHATWHSNGRDVWVVSHGMNSSIWHAFLVSCDGVVEEVVSESGRFFEMDEFASNAIGSLKISPQGNRIAATCTEMDAETSINHQTFILYGSFDNSSGEVSIEGEILHQTESSHQGYGLSYSPNGELLYYSLLASQCKLFQYDFNAPNLAESQVELASGGGAYANIQLAPNGVVYIARGSGSQFLSAIMNPDVPGLECNYTEVAVELSGLSSLGLPNIWMYPYPEQVTDEQEQVLNLCEGEMIVLEAPQSPGSSYLWSNGSTSQQISVSEPGEYSVEVSNQCHLLSRWDFIVNPVDAPELEINSSIDSPCTGDEVEVSVSSNAEWSWSDGSTNNPLLVSSSSDLVLTYSENGCNWQRTHEISFNSPPSIDLEEDYLLCDHDELELRVIGNTGDEVLWSTGESSSSILISESGWYEVDVLNSCGEANKSFDVIFEDCACDVFLPNSFSPNQDGINEVFEVHSECDLQDFHWIIFNRWGEKVFESNDQASFWLGNHKQKAHFVPDGVYFYTLEYSTPKLDRVQVQGHVTLVR